MVSLEWGETEMLVSLGVQPVGVADIKGYNTWNTAAKLDGSAKDVGTRGEPSVDSIAALQPDLIVMVNDSAAFRRAAGERRRHVRPHGDRTGADPRRARHRDDRHAVLHLAAVAHAGAPGRLSP